MKENKESFEWLSALPKVFLENIEKLGIPRDQWVKIVVKTTNTTDHSKDKANTDPEHPIRKYDAEELKMAARTLIGKPITVDHIKGTEIEGSEIIWSEWNPLTESIEAFGYVPKELAAKARVSPISGSVHYGFVTEEVEGKTTTPKMMVLQDYTILSEKGQAMGMKSGDSSSKMYAFESIFQSKMEAIAPLEEIPEEEVKEEIKEVVEEKVQEVIPEASPEQVEEVAEEVAEEITEEVPEAPIEEQAEAESETPAETSAETPKEAPIEKPETPKEPERPEPKTPTVEDLQQALDKSSQTIEKMKTDHSTKISEAQKKAKREILSKIEKEMPSGIAYSRWPMSANHFRTKIMKILYEEKKELEE